MEETSGSSTRGPQRRPTIYDVAEVAGVAASTVSRALSRPGRVSSETAELVREAAKKVGYWREERKPVLAPGTSRLLGMLVADIENPVFATVAHGATRAADIAGYTLLLAHFAESDQQERLAADRLLGNVEGLILASPRLSNSGIRTIAKNRPVVVLNREVPGVPSILTDGIKGGKEAVRHLAGLGHETITYLSGPESSWADGTRWRGIEEETQARGMIARRLPHCDPTVRSGSNAADEWMVRPTSAVVAYNDMLALGFMRELKARGVHLPGEVSLLGFDNSTSSAFTTPTLTSVASPLLEQGAFAISVLRKLIVGEDVSTQPILLPLKLFARQSTGPFDKRAYDRAIARLRSSIP